MIVTFVTLIILVSSLIVPTHVSAHVNNDDKQVTTAPSIQSEVSMVVNPLHPNNIIVGYNDWVFQELDGIPIGGHWAAGYGYSIDGGNTWKTGGLPAATGMPNLLPKDDTGVAFDTSGNAYFVALANQLQAILLYTSSPDGSGNAGGSWSTGTVVASAANNCEAVDKPAIAVDNTGGAHNGNIYITWVHFDYCALIDTTVETIMLRTAKLNAGVPVFTGAAVAASPARDEWNWGPGVAVAPDGSAYVSYMRMSDQPIWAASSVMISRSDDGGATFALSGQQVSGITPPTWNTGCHQGTLPWIVSNTNCSGRTSAMPTLAINSDGTLILAWTDARSGTATDILSSHSTDRGATWSAPVQVDRHVNGRDQFEPAAAATNGVVWVFYYDRSYDKNNDLILLSGATSTNNGASFGPPHGISDQFIAPDVCGSNWYGGCPFGDYIAAAATNSTTNLTFYVAWSGDNPNAARGDSNVDVFVEKFNATAPFSPASLAYLAPPGIDIWNNSPNINQTLCTRFPRYCLPLAISPCISDPPFCRATLTAEILPIEGFSSTVNLYATNMSSGVIVQITPPSGLPPFNATITIDASSAAPLSCVSPCEDDINLHFNSSLGVRNITLSLMLTNKPLLGISSNLFNATDPISLEGRGFTANSTVTLTLDGVSYASTPTDRHGSFNLSSILPTTLLDGKHLITATDTHSNSANVTFLSPKGEAEPAEIIPKITPTSTITSGASLLLAILSSVIALRFKRRKLRNHNSLHHSPAINQG